MTIFTTDDKHLPLDFESSGRATLPAGIGDMTPEEAGAVLLKVIRSHAAELTEGAAVELVSVTLDVTGDMPASAPIQFVVKSDRKTRTILFTGGHAEIAGKTVLTATAVFRILSGET